MHWVCVYRPQNDLVESKEVATLLRKSNVPPMATRFKKCGLFMPVSKRLEMIVPVLHSQYASPGSSWCRAVHFDW
jgi:hypothetical protein